MRREDGSLYPPRRDLPLIPASDLTTPPSFRSPLTSARFPALSTLLSAGHVVRGLEGVLTM